MPLSATCRLFSSADAAFNLSRILCTHVVSYRLNHVVLLLGAANLILLLRASMVRHYIAAGESSIKEQLVLLESTAATHVLETELAEQMSAALIEKLRELGCFRYFVPRAYGGMGGGLLHGLEILEALSRGQDPSDGPP